MKNGPRVLGPLLLTAVLGAGLALGACGGAGTGGTAPAGTITPAGRYGTAAPARPSASPGAGYRDDYGY